MCKLFYSMCTLQGNFSSRFSGNSVAFVSELPENLEEMFSYMHKEILFSTLSWWNGTIGY